MSTTPTTNLALLKPDVPTEDDAWGDLLNTIFDILDDVIGSTETKSVAGSANITLTATEARPVRQKYTGTLTGNIEVRFPTGTARSYVITNATAGAFTLTAIIAGNTGVVIQQGRTVVVSFDGTNAAPIPGWLVYAGTSSGTNTITATPSPAITAYVEGMVVVFEAGGTCTGACTININSIGAIAIQKLGAALVANDITAADMVVGVIRDVAGTKTLQMTSPARAVAALDIVTDTTPQLGGVLDTNSKAIDESEGAAVASATTTNIWVTDGNTVHITGTTTITSLGTAARAGAIRQGIFDGILTLTNGANLILPGGVNITTAAGDSFVAYADTTTQIRVLAYTKASGLPIVAASSGAMIAIERKTGSAVAAYDFATGIDGTYPTYKLIGWLLPATDQVTVWIRGSDDGGATYEADADDYGWANHGFGSAEISNFDVFDAQMSMLIGATSDLVGNASTEGIAFEITFHAPSSAALAKKFHWSFSYIDAQATPEIRFGVGGGAMKAAAAMNAVRLMFSSGNIASGDVTLYGIANA